MKSIQQLEILIKRVETLYKSSSIELRVKAGLKMSAWYTEDIVKKDNIIN